MDTRFFVTGLNHLETSVQCRERLVRADSSLEDSFRRLRIDAGLTQAVLLSTCSRLEVYGWSSDPAAARARTAAWFIERAGLEARRHLDERVGGDALAHLFRVTAGLESWILGETEILSQVRKAYSAAVAAGAVGAEFHRIFQSAVAAGKAARAATGIQDGIHSIGGAAALLARRIFGERDSGRVVVFGAGEAAQAVCRHLAAKDFNRLLIANRTRERAEELARLIGGQAASFEEGLGALAEADAAVFSVSSSGPVLERAELERRLAGRHRPIFLIDLGLPRNVDPECASLPDVFLYGLDDLKDVVARSMERKAGVKKEAEAVVRQAAADCILQLEKARRRREAAPAA